MGGQPKAGGGGVPKDLGWPKFEVPQLLGVTVFKFDVCSVYWLVNAVESFDPEGIAPKNPLPADFKKEVLKYVPTMRQYGLDGAADHMHAWVMGTLPLEPLLDVSASPGRCSSCHFRILRSCPRYVFFVFKLASLDADHGPSYLRCALKSKTIFGAAAAEPQSLEQAPGNLG